MSKRPRHVFDEDLPAQQSQYVVFGTPLPPLDPEASDDGSYVPIWKQTVTDKRGRKRLHGAFTGGFSAGYFNTVGSKHGWTPSNFVSSRRSGSSQPAPVSRPEDYMDEEDLADLAEAEHVRTSASFASLGASQSDQSRLSLNRSAEETIGIRMLNKMGWRQGQGIGPMVRRRADLNDSVEISDDTQVGSHLFAPQNTPIILLQKKSNSRGLGAESVDNQESLLLLPSNDWNSSDDEPWTPVRNKSVKHARTGATNKRNFGTGALSHVGSDEEDPYAVGPRISFSVTSARDRQLKGSESKKSTHIKPRSSTRPIFTSKKLDRNLNKILQLCQDGKAPLAGFLLSKSSVQAGIIQFLTPRVPENWTPRATPPLSRSTSHLPSSSVSLDHTSRGRALGEKSLPGRSVFDFMSPGARDRIATFSRNESLPPGRGEQNISLLKGMSTAEDDWASFASLPKKEVAESALGRLSGGWSPYSIDKEKASRYQSFLEVCAGIKKPPSFGQSGMSKRDWINELREFAHAVQVFRPVTGMMASRFTAATNMNQTSSPSLDTLDEAQLNPRRSTSREAAMTGLFGPLTRSTHSFHPTRLVYKRFGMQLPAVHHDNTMEPMHDLSDSPRLVDHTVAAKGDISSGFSTHRLSKPLVELQQSQVVNPDSNGALEADRAGDEIFKVIFSSSNN